MTPKLPPLPEIYPVIDHPEHHMKWTRPEVKWIQKYATDYALAALAQQAQGEPVYQVRGAFDADPVNTWRDTTETAFFFHPVNQRRILYTTPQPAPPAPAPVDERAEFEASMREKHGWEDRDFKSDSFGYFDGHTATAWLAWQARDAPSKPAPLAGDVTDEQMVAALEAAGVSFMRFQGGISGRKDVWTTEGSQDVRKIADGVRAILALRPTETLTGCNCRWDGETQVEWCELHLAHKEAIHEWAERAKAAEQQLALRPQAVPMTDDQIVQGQEQQGAQSILSFMKGVRFVEAHHGITAKAEGAKP